MPKTPEQITFYGRVTSDPRVHDVHGYRTVRMDVTNNTSTDDRTPKVHKVRTHGRIIQETVGLFLQRKLTTGTVVYIQGTEVVKPNGPYTASEKFIKATVIQPVKRSDFVLWT